MNRGSRWTARLLGAWVVGLVGVGPGQAAERPLDLALRAALTDYCQFDESDFGFGAEVSYRFTDWLAADAQLTLFPSDLGEPASFSGSRFEGLFGLRLGAAGFYATLRPGFVNFGEPSGPMACILIFPPPLVCTLGGKSVFALNYGAGFELLPGERLLLRAELGDLLLKYPGPAFDKDMEVFEDSLWSHNLRATLSVGLRF